MTIFGRATTLEPELTEAKRTSGAIALVDDALRAATGRETFTPADATAPFDLITIAVVGDRHDVDILRVIGDATREWRDRAIVPAGVTD
jgi:hypothetical protein